jgi:hypothetical protein
MVVPYKQVYRSDDKIWRIAHTGKVKAAAAVETARHLILQKNIDTA